MNVNDFARRYLGQFNQKGNEIIPRYCPFCNGGQHRDKYSFALNIDKLTYNCKRGTCNKSGTFKELCSEFGENADIEINNLEFFRSKKEYKKPKTELKPIGNKAFEYLKLRGISEETINYLKVSSDDKGNIVFPFYDENQSLVFLKFRPSKKVGKGELKSWREEGGKPVLWCMDICDTKLKYLIITEGEIDTMSCYEAGLKNCVSIPSGCEDFSWIETCWSWLQQFEIITLFGDSDDAGIKMVKALINKLSDFRIKVVSNKYKDANELLYKEGKEEVKKVVELAKEIPVQGLIQLADIEPENPQSRVIARSPWNTLDKITGGSPMGCISIWSGKRGNGKSTAVGQMLIDAIENGFKVCAYSGELKNERFKYWIDLQIAGSDNIESYFDSFKMEEKYFVNKEKRKIIEEWYRDKFWIYDSSIIDGIKEETTNILKLFEYAAKRYDCKIFLIDNLMTAREHYFKNEKDFYRAQGDFIRNIKAFAKKHDTHVHIVAHPKKTNNVNELDNDDVSGTTEITDLADFTYYVSKCEDTQRPEINTIIKVGKNREDGTTGQIGLSYCKKSRRLYLCNEKSNSKVYSWEKMYNTKKLSLTSHGELEECPF